MPTLYNKQLGHDTFVPQEMLQQAIDSGNYVIPPDLKVVAVTPKGNVVEGPASALPGQKNIQVAPEEVATEAKRQAAFDEKATAVGTFIHNFANTVSFGGLGTLERLADKERYVREQRAEAKHPVASIAGTAAGILAPLGAAKAPGAIGSIARAMPVARASRAGTAVSEALGGGVLGHAAGYGLEGGLLNVGAGVQELTASEDPITVERIFSTLPSSFLHGVGPGAALGGGGTLAMKAGQKALSRMGRFFEESKGAAVGRPEVVEDLVGKGHSELRAMKEAEATRIGEQRVVGKASVGEEISQLYNDTQKSKWWHSLLGEGGKVEKGSPLASASAASVKADRALRNLADVPKTLNRDPQLALRALERAETAMQMVKDQMPQLRTKFAANADVPSLKRLNKIDGFLSRNRAIQAKIKELYGPATSERLGQIEDAMSNLGMAKPKSALERVVERTAGTYALSAAAGFLPGGMIGALGASAAPEVMRKLVSTVFSRLGRSVVESGNRTSSALETFFDAGKKVVAGTPPIAARVISGSKKMPLREAFTMKEKELRNQTMMGPMGTPVMRPSSRQVLAKKLDAIRAVNPMMADQLETLGARRIEFLASKLPKLPDIAATNPDAWQHSDLKLATFGRYVAAADDLGGVEERLADGTITPEDAETYKALAPTRFAAIQQQIMEHFSELGKLPYQRRLALSIFSGIAVDPMMQPQILMVLQSQYTEEPGTGGGMMPPTATPQFGSIKQPEDPTPAQKRMA